MANTFNNDSTVADDIHIGFGDSDDFRLEYNSTDNHLEIKDSGGTVLTFISDEAQQGTHTPTLSGGVNVASSGAIATKYMKVGEIVSVAFRAHITPTSGAPTLTQFEFNLPFTTNLTSNADLRGNFSWLDSTAGAIGAGYIDGEVTNETAKFQFYAATTNLHTLSGAYMFEVK